MVSKYQYPLLKFSQHMVAQYIIFVKNLVIFRGRLGALLSVFIMIFSHITEGN